MMILTVGRAYILFATLLATDIVLGNSVEVISHEHDVSKAGDMAELRQQLLQVVSRLDQLENSFVEMSSKVNGHDAQISAVQAYAQENSVAFSAVNTAGELFTLDPDVTMPYPSVTFQQGSGYDDTTSTFTCPVTGLYYFSASIVGGKQSGAWYDDNIEDWQYYFEQLSALAVYLDDVNTAAIPLFDYWDVNDHWQEADFKSNRASTAVVVSCASGSSVKVKATDLSYIQCPTGACIFSGFLIEQLQ